ncbi:MAG: hypothetical protein ABIQ74_02350 [Chitinophagales bacterium]
MQKIFFIIILLTFLRSNILNAQPGTNIIDTAVNAKLLSLSYAFQVPFADMASRFGSNHNIGTAFTFKMAHNLMIGAEGNFLFGGNIREDTIIDGLFTSQGFFIGTNGIAESVILFERGFSFFGKAGKLFTVGGSNPNSGLNVMVGAGFLQHKIKIDDPDKAVPFVDGEYSKGYDRLTNGFAISQYAGYLHLDARRFLNFNAGIEIIEAFTQNRRDFNFDQMKKDDSERVDILLSFKLSWVLPFYGKGEQRFYTH